MAERTQTLVQLTDDLVRHLDRRARARGVSRSAVIRDLLEEGLREDRASAVAERLIEGYGRQPQQLAEDAWGDLDRWTEVNVRRNLAGLAAEEDGRW